jgi:hypothetical protein
MDDTCGRGWNFAVSFDGRRYRASGAETMPLSCVR